MEEDQPIQPSVYQQRAREEAKDFFKPVKIKTGHGFLPPQPKKARDLKLILIALTAFFILVAIPLTLSLVKQRQEIRKEAVGENQLVCMPIDNNGNLTNEKYHYNRIKVINNTDQDVRLWNQRNFCDYEANPQDPYRCDLFGNYDLDIVPKGSEKIFSIQPDCYQTGQLDIWRCEEGGPECENSGLPECYNTVDEQIWEGGIAFTIYSRVCDLTPTPTPTPTPTGAMTPTPTPTITPSPTPTGTITPTPEYGLNCQQLKTYDDNWQEKDLSNLSIGETVYFLVRGTCDEPQGITDARFRVNGGEWLEPTGQKEENFYLEYEINRAGDYQVEAIVYNPALGWR